MKREIREKEEFVLTLSPKYVPNWNKWEAFRELMQNVIDRKNELASAEIIFSYNQNKQRITIGNKLSFLDRKTLILGETTKTDNEDAIGKYGEGYKLALLVFLRMGIRIRIRTGNEVWAPAIKFSKQFGTVLLTITSIKTTPTDDLLFELDGVTAEDYRIFKSNCLYLDTIESKITTEMGDILLEDKFKSRLFVEGLFVCHYNEGEKIRYGYNMKARHIQLDRDRQKVSSWSLTFELGRMYNLLDSTHATLVYSLQNNGFNDAVHYKLYNYNKDNPLYQAICSLHYNDFVAMYGKNVIPVSSQQEADFVKEKYNNLVPVLLSQTKYEYITESSAYKVSSKAKVPLEETPYSIIKKNLNKHLVGKKYKEVRECLLNELLPLARQWRKR